MALIPTTTGRRHEPGALSRWLRRNGSGAVRLVVLSCLVVCGPSIGAPPEVQQWMLGVFSSHQPVNSSDTHVVIQYHVYDTLEVSALVVTVNGPVSDFRRVWEPRGDDAFAMFPSEEEPGTTAVSEYVVRPEEGASAE